VDELLCALVSSIHGLREESALAGCFHEGATKSELRKHVGRIDQDVQQWVGRLSKDLPRDLDDGCDAELLLNTIQEVHIFAFRRDVEDPSWSEDSCSRYAQALLRYSAETSQGEPLITEAVCLCVHGRAEFYIAASETRRLAAIECFDKFARSGCGATLEVEDRRLFTKSGREATRHLFEVSAGLQSQVPGEVQVLFQVKACYDRTVADRVAAAEGTGDAKTIVKMLNAAVRAGKLVRSQTRISKGAVSASAAAVELMGARAIGALGRPSVSSACVVGEGQAARLLLIHLAKQHPDLRIHLACSTAEAAEGIILEAKKAFAGAGSAVAVRIAELPELRCDALLLALEMQMSAAVRSESVAALDQTLRQLDSSRRMLLIDTSDIPVWSVERASDWPFVCAHGSSDVQSVLAKNIVARENEAWFARDLLSQQIDDFQVWLCAQGGFPYLAALQARGEAIRQNETDKMALKLKGLKEQDREALDVMTKAIVTRLLSPVMDSMRGPEDTTHDKRDKIAGLRDIFVLKPHPNRKPQLPPPANQ
ncbi:unnamed protein product, partial [Polarella glacialis]